MRQFRLPVLLFLLTLLLAGVSTYHASAQRTRELIVRLRPGYSVKDLPGSLSAPLRSIRSVLPITPSDRSTLALFRLDRYVVVTLVEGATRGEELVGSSPVVEEVVENHRYRTNQHPNDSLFDRQYAFQRLELEAAWERTRGAASILVGFVDTGIDYDHPDLRGAFAVNESEDLNGNGVFDPWPSVESRGGVTGDLNGVDDDGNGYADDVIGYDFVDQVVPNVGDWSTRDADPFDDNGHGTTVAGVVAARADNGIGVAGAAPGVRIVALRSFDASGNGDDDDVAAATVYAVDRGVRVINMSFGDYYDSPLLHDAVRYARSRGVLVVASAGNEAISELHFPSAFPEVMSVGSTTREDNLSSFSSFGSQLSVTAPGSDIQTLSSSSGYTRSSGTSLSAPYVTAVAALLFSLHPSWTPDEVQTTLELTSDDLGRAGWDVYFGAGRINARRAVDYPGPPSVSIVTPDFGAGFRAAGSMAVVGSAISALLKSWRLDIGLGEAPSDWRSITNDTDDGRLNDTLGILDLNGLVPAVWTIRLQLSETNGHVTERRARIVVGDPPPNIVQVDTADVWRFDRRAFFVSAVTNQLTELTVRIRPLGGSTWRSLALQPERSGNRQVHHVVITDEEMAPGIPYDYYIVAKNGAGDTAMIGSELQPLRHVRDGEGFPTLGFVRRQFDLPYGYVQNDVALLLDGKPTTVMNEFGADGDFGPLALYQENAGDLIRRDTIATSWAPRGFGDIDGDGLTEMLGQSFGSGIIFGQATQGGSPLARVRFVDTSSGNFYAAELADFDGDGKDEVVARTSNLGDPAFYVSRVVDGRLVAVATLPNTTSPARGDAQNFLGPPVVAVADFDGDGRNDILFGDEDSDFMIYRNRGGLAFEQMWSVENEGNGGTEYVAAADVDGDGRMEAVVAFHSRLAVFPGEEYPPPYWTVQIYRFDESGAGTLIWSDRFLYVRPTNTLRSGIGAGDLDGVPGDEVALLLFPNTYILHWDSSYRALKPLWWKGASIGNKPMVADVDGDGRNELGIGDGARIRFYHTDGAAPRVKSPASLVAYGVNDSTAYVRWSAAPAADRYRVYRAASSTGAGPLQFDSLTTTTSTELIDSGIAIPSRRLAPSTWYFYIITSIRDSGAYSESPFGNPVVAFTHRPATLIAGESRSPATIELQLDGQVSDRFLRPDVLEVNDSSGHPLPVSTTVSGGASRLVATLRTSYTGLADVALTSLFRDAWGSPGDTGGRVRVRVQGGERPGARFIATSATPSGSFDVVVRFSAPVDGASMDVSRFVVAPERVVASATLNPSDPTSCLLRLDESTPLGPHGRVYTVTIDGLTDVSGRTINDGAGSVVGFVISAADLSSTVVFPQPFSVSKDGTLTIGGLTPTATVRVLTQAGVEVVSLETREGTGGVAWNGRDARGEMVPPGVYLFIATTRSSDGTERDSRVGKIAVTP